MHLFYLSSVSVFTVFSGCLSPLCCLSVSLESTQIKSRAEIRCVLYRSSAPIFFWVSDTLQLRDKNKKITQIFRCLNHGRHLLVLLILTAVHGHLLMKTCFNGDFTLLGTFIDDSRVKKRPISLVSRWLDHPYIWVFLEHISSYV